MVANGRLSISVVGGGPAAIELAGNAQHLALTTGCKNIDVRIFAGNKMLAGFRSFGQEKNSRQFQGKRHCH